jgi:hypothetical protein
MAKVDDRANRTKADRGGPEKEAISGTKPAPPPAGSAAPPGVPPAGPATGQVDPRKVLQKNLKGIPIIIVGDVALDWLAANYQHRSDDHPPPPRGATTRIRQDGEDARVREGDESRRWTSQPQVQMLAMASGAWLVENFMVQIGPWEANPHPHYCYRRPRCAEGEVQRQAGDLQIGVAAGVSASLHSGVIQRRTADPETYLHTFTELREFERFFDEHGTCMTLCSKAPPEASQECTQAPTCPLAEARRDGVANPRRTPELASAKEAVVGDATEDRTRLRSIAHRESSKKKSYRIVSPSRYWGPKAGVPGYRPGIDELRRRWYAGEARFQYTKDAKVAAHRNEGSPLILEQEDQFRKDKKLYKLFEPDGKHLIVIFDGGYGFRTRPNGEAGAGKESRWEKILPVQPQNGWNKDEADGSHVVLLLRPPFPDAEENSGNPLWDHLAESYADRTTVVVSAESLRREGINISRSLSWERTAQDFATELWSNPVLRQLSQCRHLIVRFGLTGAIHYHRRSRPGTKGGDHESNLSLFYDPRYVEGEYPDPDPKKHGRMTGMTVLLTATVARSIADGWHRIGSSVDWDLNTWVEAGIRTGLRNCRKLYCHGFGSTPEDVLRLETEDRWTDSFLVPDADLVGGPPILRSEVEYNSTSWALLHFKSEREIEKIAETIVRIGPKEILSGSKQQFPSAKFGDHWVVDREEIESFRSIRNLLQDHRDKRKTLPLSIAVFGPPGSGKSRGVREIANSLSKSSKDVEFKTYNMAQFVQSVELGQALLPIRDFALDGKMAVVFFDEFDSKLDGDRLGWLKYFLPIMQDGEFKHGEGTIKTGGAVFVFAGGTSRTYQEFCRVDAPEDEQIDFRERKGPDFVSRLRGYVNIRGADQQNEADKVYMIRRAISLRSMLRKDYPSLFSNDSELNIDPSNDSELSIDDNVLHALLQIERFKHGSRSLEAILEMSHLANATHFDASRLPSVDQLDMHVDARMFMKILKGTR